MTTWRKSSYSGGPNDQCVEVSTDTADRQIRDSKNKNGERLSMTTGAFRRLISSIKAHDYEI